MQRDHVCTRSEHGIDQLHLDSRRISTAPILRGRLRKGSYPCCTRFLAALADRGWGRRFLFDEQKRASEIRSLTPPLHVSQVRDALWTPSRYLPHLASAADKVASGIGRASWHELTVRHGVKCVDRLALIVIFFILFGSCGKKKHLQPVMHNVVSTRPNLVRLGIAFSLRAHHSLPSIRDPSKNINFDRLLIIEGM